MRAKTAPIVLSLSLAVLLSAVAAPGARAQLGGLVKRAAGKVAGDAAKKQIDDHTGTATDLRPETYGEPFTDETLAAVIRGEEAANAAGANRNRLVMEQRETAQRADSLERLPGHEADARRYQEATQKYQACFSDANRRAEAANDARMQQMQGRMMSDDATRQKMTASMQRIAAAQQRGDTAEVRRLSEAMQREMGLHVSGDSAAGKKACGAAPARPAWMRDVALLRAQNDSLAVRIRGAEAEMQSAGARAAGMTSTRYALQRERLMLWVGLTTGNRNATFSADERAVFEKHQGDIDRVHPTHATRETKRR